jgi:hypothetical protein
MKRIAGNGKRCLKTITGGCAYGNGVFVEAEGLDFFRLGVVATGGRLSHQATCPL